MKLKTIFIILSLFSLLVSCYESDPIDISGNTIIFKMQNTNTYVSDTITLFGEHLGIAQDSSYLVLNDTTILHSKNCLIWNVSKIEFIIPKLPKHSNLYVVVSGNKVFYEKDEENIGKYYQYINVAPFPVFESVLIEAGNYNMGTKTQDNMDFGRENEKPSHNVIINNDIYVSKSEVTQRLYSIIMENNPSELQHDSYPVYNVKWADAIRFCNALSIADSLTPAYTIIESPFYVSFDTSASGWRLPTEAEWEYFANINVNSEEELNDYAWYADNSALRPQSAMLRKPNTLGLYDILGNVWEWCWDYYQADYYNISPVVNPLGPTSGSEHVIRGGSCDDEKISLRKQYRQGHSDSNYNSSTKIGIRLVRKS